MISNQIAREKKINIKRNYKLILPCFNNTENNNINNTNIIVQESSSLSDIPKQTKRQKKKEQKKKLEENRIYTDDLRKLDKQISPEKKILNTDKRIIETNKKEKIKIIKPVNKNKEKKMTLSLQLADKTFNENNPNH